MKLGINKCTNAQMHFTCSVLRCYEEAAIAALHQHNRMGPILSVNLTKRCTNQILRNNFNIPLHNHHQTLKDNDAYDCLSNQLTSSTIVQLKSLALHIDGIRTMLHMIVGSPKLYGERIVSFHSRNGGPGYMLGAPLLTQGHGQCRPPHRPFPTIFRRDSSRTSDCTTTGVGNDDTNDVGGGALSPTPVPG